MPLTLRDELYGWAVGLVIQKKKNDHSPCRTDISSSFSTSILFFPLSDLHCAALRN